MIAAWSVAIYCGGAGHVCSLQCRQPERSRLEAGGGQHEIHVCWYGCVERRRLGHEASACVRERSAGGIMGTGRETCARADAVRSAASVRGVAVRAARICSVPPGQRAGWHIHAPDQNGAPVSLTLSGGLRTSRSRMDASNILLNKRTAQATQPAASRGRLAVAS
eukprot:scaffold273210_cov27-Tisochrysis_lutea.AAC.3